MHPDVIVTSRSFDEYAAFFALDPDALPATIVDVSAGAAGFTAEANRRGSRAMAVDPAYSLDDDHLTQLVRAGIARGQGMIDDNTVRYTYGWYGTAERRTRLRADALADFLADRRANPERYVEGALPELPFGDDTFDLVLCSHLLFTWAGVFDETWHDAALAELLRVGREVRIFPFVLRGSGDAIEFVPRVVERVRRAGHGVDVRATGYEFQVGVKDALILTRAGQAQSSKSR